VKFYVGIRAKADIMWVKERFMTSFQVLRRYKKVWCIPDWLEWIMDSGAFSELKRHGKYKFTPEEYFDTVQWWQPDYFVNMDWMCEETQLKKTGKTITEHQQLSLENQIKLYELLEDSWIKPHCGLIGTIQGWDIPEYIDHIDQLREHDMILPRMGIGSICRRGESDNIEAVCKAIRKELPDTHLHGFGVKNVVLRRPSMYDYLDSVDSLAWCWAGWRVIDPPRRLFGEPCHIHEYKRCIRNADDCSTCGRFMNHWVEKNLSLIETRGNT